MNKETKKALEASISHWEDNVNAENFDAISIDGSSCALCSLFFNLSTYKCYGCPVFLHTGEHSCRGTPWKAASVELWAGSGQSFKEAAQVELDFLKSLRETEKE